MELEHFSFFMVRKISLWIGVLFLLFSYSEKGTNEIRGMESGTIQVKEIKQETREEKKKIEGYAIGYLKIPKLKLNLPFYSLESEENTVSKNIQVIKSNMPDVENGNFILAGHSGNSSVSYFRNLDHLEIGDEVNVIYNGKEYFYEVLLLYETPKENILWRNPTNETILTMITCVPFSEKRLMVVARQI